MPKNLTKTQKSIIEDVMHDYKKSKLKSSSGNKVKNRKQAIAIGLNEAGASKYESKKTNKKNIKHTMAKKRKSK